MLKLAFMPERRLGKIISSNKTNKKYNIRSNFKGIWIGSIKFKAKTD